MADDKLYTELLDKMQALQFSEVAIKLTALGSKNSLALALAYAKENPKVKGKTSLDRLLRENKELKVIPIQSADISKFKEYAKQYGVLFAVIKDKTQSEKVDIMFKAEDVSKLNRIYEQLGYAPPEHIPYPGRWRRTLCDSRRLYGRGSTHLRYACGQPDRAGNHRGNVRRT